MRKTISSVLILALMLLIGTASASEAALPDMDALAEINTVKSLLQNYDTVTYAQLDYVGGNTMHVTFSTDESGNPVMIDDGNGYSGYQTDSFSFARENGTSTYTVFATETQPIGNYLLMVQGSEFTDQKIDGGGNWFCEATANIDEEYAEALSENWEVTTEDKMVTAITFAPDDFRVLSIDFSVRRPDGSEVKIASSAIFYNLELQFPESVQNYLDAEKFAVTVQMADGSVKAAQIPKGECFTWTCDDGYALYMDASGETPVSETSDPVDRDLTLYCLPNA